MKNLLGAWSASVGAAPPTSYLPSPANTATSFTSTSTSSSSIGFASQSATPASVTQFRAFVEQVLSTTKVSSAVIVLALKYLQRLSRNRHLISKSSVLITSPDSCRLALIVTLVLSNKYSDDERFTNAAWAGVAGIDVDVLNRAELEALDAIQWTLTVSEEEYTRWIEIVSTFASNTAAACELVERQKHQAKVQQEQQQLILAAARQDEHRQQSLQLRHAQPQQHSFRSRTAPLTPITVSSSSPLSVFPYPKPRSAPSEPSVTWVAPPSAAIYDRRGSASMFPPSQMIAAYNAPPPLDGTEPPPNTDEKTPSVKGTIWFDNIFPIRYYKYDPRWLWVRKYANEAGKAATSRLIPKDFPATFKYLGATPNWKEGGLFVHFKYEGHSVDEAVETIRNHIEKRGIRNWSNMQMCRVYLVRGHPWVDDMLGRLPSQVLKVEFSGPDASVEELYKDFRQYGKIVNITLQPANVKDLPRFALIEFMRVRSATSARNCLNGEAITGTTININYEKKRGSSENFWTWVSNHPRITIPVLLGLLAGLTYVVFDPVRVFFITNQLTERFSLKAYTGAAEQLWSSTQNAVGAVWGHKQRDSVTAPETWTERQADLARLQHHLKQTPDTVVLVNGPKGSGKSQLVRKAIEASNYKLVIRCDELAGQPTHIALNRLATQINFKPMFNWYGFGPATLYLR
ncbi:mitochondrial escape protein 2 [Thoreauomyces humboldtii]|nr:mitochondrial escape protein 2 [Thoreauomyces humboldtii]